MDKLDSELAGIEELGASDMNHLRSKIQLISSWMQKKSKLLSPFSDLMLRAGGGLALLLSHVEISDKNIEEREKLIMNRIKALDMVDEKSMSRLKGFEVFKLYLILCDKLKMLKSKESLDQKGQDSLVLRQQVALVEAQYLLEGDTLAPLQIFRTIPEKDTLPQINNLVREKYK